MNQNKSSFRSGSRYRPRRYSTAVRRPAGPSRRQAGQPRLDIAKLINQPAPAVEESYSAKHAFVDFALTGKLKQNIKTRGYTTPTPIQDRVIPEVLAGRDVVGLANTGTGKTAAFIIPLINRVLKDSSTRVLIMTPTRELAIQINDELKLFTVGLGVKAVVCVGGAPIGRQITDLGRNHHFIIGTPGRLKDLIDRKVLKLADVTTVVLDEADRMLDMGFIKDMRRIIGLTNPKRQTLFFSATISGEADALIKDFLTDPIRISVKTRDTAAEVRQDVIRLKVGDDKVEVLIGLLTQTAFNRVLIFGRTKHGVERLAKQLFRRGLKAESIHGNKTHNNRQRALLAFKTNRIQVLVATDVAARGLDIADVSHVINFDLPTTYDDYIHRIGRTGRAGKTGQALTFVN